MTDLSGRVGRALEFLEHEHGDKELYDAISDQAAAYQNDIQRLEAELKAKDERIAELAGQLDAAEQHVKILSKQRDEQGYRLDAVHQALAGWNHGELASMACGKIENLFIRWGFYGAVDVPVPVVEGRWPCMGCDVLIPEQGYCRSCIEDMRKRIDLDRGYRSGSVSDPARLVESRGPVDGPKARPPDAEEIALCAECGHESGDHFDNCSSKERSPMDREESWDAPQDPGHHRTAKWGWPK